MILLGAKDPTRPLPVEPKPKETSWTLKLLQYIMFDVQNPLATCQL